MASPEVSKNEGSLVVSNDSDVFARQLNENGQKPGKARRVFKALGLSALALLLGGGAFLALTEVGRDTTRTLTQYAPAIYEARSNPDLIFDQIGPQVNILLIGRDVNWKIGKVYDPKTGKYRPYQVHDESAQARSDTMIVVSLDKEKKTIRMVSFPRDAIVRLADNDYGVRRTKLNAAHAYGGPPLLIKTLHDELGLTIHRHAVIKFDGFKNLIDQVGGVEVNVEGALKRDRHGKLYRGNLDYDDNWGNLHIHLKPGLQKLDGDTAHAYVRFRMDREGDPGRIRRQQAVMKALAKQMTQVSPWQLPGLIQEVQKQFISDLTPGEMASAAAFAKSIGEAGKIQPLTLFGDYTDRGSIHLNKPKNEKLLSYIFGPTFNAERFLNRSPWTRSAEIGPDVESNPEARHLLIEAGLLPRPDGSYAEPSSPHNAIPTRIEETAPRTADAYNVPTRSSRYATAQDDVQDEETPRRVRRTRAKRENHEQNVVPQRAQSKANDSEAAREPIILAAPEPQKAEKAAPETSSETVFGASTAREESSAAGASREAEHPAPTVETTP